MNSSTETFIGHYHQLGVRVDAIQMSQTISAIEEWIGSRGSARYVVLAGMHGLTEAQKDSSLKAALNDAALVVPDGMPLVWLGRYHGFPLKRRVYGPELMLRFCEVTQDRGYRHFFYGGREGVAELLAETLRERFPGLVIAGTFCPPFRPLTSGEEAAVTALIEQTRPDILWVGLGAPNQEKWMHAHRHLSVPVMIGVGAAFDINTGRLQQAPHWMREIGLEWLFRLMAEPRRLWRRYLVLGPKFVFYILTEMAHLRDFGSKGTSGVHLRNRPSE